MKKKIHKILGVGLTLAIALSLVAGFALPVAAAETINEWYTFDYPVEGADGDWFRDADITNIGPMAEAINGDLYAASGIGVGDFELGSSNDATAEWRTDEAYTGSYSVYLSVPTVDDYAEVYFSVNVKLEDIDLGNTSFWAWSTNGDYIPYFIFEMKGDFGGGADLLWINNDAAASGPFDGGWAEFAASDAIGPWQWATIDTTTWSWIDGGWDTWSNLVTTYGAETVSCVLVENSGITLNTEWPLSAYIDDITINGVTYKMDPKYLFKSTDGGRSWEETDYADDLTGEGAIVDMVCSSIDEDILYVTDGNYVYKSVDGGDEFNFVAKDSLEEALMEECGRAIINRPITCIDVGYDDDDNPFVFIGTKQLVTRPSPPGGFFPSTVLWIGEAGYPATWTDLRLECYADGRYGAYSIGVAPDFADTKETYVVVSAGRTLIVPIWGAQTHVVSTIGVTCSWTEFAELKQDCVDSFDIQAASRIGFPDDWEDTETLFVGVVDYFPVTRPGGDVYLVTEDGAIDLNVEGISTGCVGKVPATNIISLDVCGDTDEASLIAGAYDDTNVYYSSDGGWEWDASEKDPTGINRTYVLWVGDCAESALAATSGCECAVSLSCGEEVGEFWNQISLIATGIDWVRSLGHSPGYVCEDSETMFMLSWWMDYPCDGETSSLFRHDGTYWERVYLGSYNDDTHIGRVYVSPDFNETNALYVANNEFGMWRSLDAGCSWDQLTFPCIPRPMILSAVVIDEDTVIAGGAFSDPEKVFKTTRHGARPWDEYEVTGAGNINSFDLEPGYEDPGTVILGDDDSQVFISEDGGETWDLVGAALPDSGHLTWVAFDPNTNGIIYAAAGTVIARCVIDPDEDWADQEWEDIGFDFDGVSIDLGLAWGIEAAGDTALYVTDSYPVGTSGGVWRSLNPDTDDAADVVFEELITGLDNGTILHDLFLTCDVSDEGCAENVLWALDMSMIRSPEDVWVYEDTLAAPVVLDMPLNEQKLGTTHSATLSWNELCGADCYEVALWSYCAECPDEKLDVDISDLMDCHDTCDEGVCYECTEEICIVVDGLESGTTYYWQVRVCEGEPKLSKWSEERSFMTALVAVPFQELCSPPCGDQDIILTPNFSWEAVDGATGYDIELATTETFTAGAIRGSSTVNAWVLSAPLDYATTYYWRVRAEKDGVLSDWTICLFTTMEEPVVPPPPVVVEPTPPAPVVPTPIIELPPTPTWVWAIIAIGTALVVVVIVLTVRTRRPPA